MSQLGTGLIGLDVKPRRRVPRSKRNRYRGTYKRWVFPTILALVSLGLFVIAGIR